MSDANLRQIRVLHVVSAGAVATSLQPYAFMPLLARMPKERVKVQVVCLAPGLIQSAVLRQSGVPVHEVSMSRQRFLMSAFKDLLQITRAFRPDVIQVWGHTAQIVSIYLRKRCDWKPKLVWSIGSTVPLPRGAGLIDRHKLKLAAKRAARADRIVYASEAAAAQHRRSGFPDGDHLAIPPGVDVARFKPDTAARSRIRDKLELEPDDFVIGMVAPFQAEYDHATFLKAAGELLKTQPNIVVVLAGHGVQKGNAPLMALVGSGTLSTRIRLLGEWSDVASLFNACDIVCSSAVTDNARMTLVMAMLCGVPCVATGIGAQGEVIGQHGVAVELGSPAAFVKGISRLLQMPADKRAALAHGARKYALQGFVSVRSLQRYLQLYYDLIGRQSLVMEAPPPDAEANAAAPAVAANVAAKKSAKKALAVEQLADPDSLEEKVEEIAEPLPKWRIEQEEQRTRREQELSRQLASADTAADVLQVFDAQVAKRGSAEVPRAAERARGVAEEIEELLPAEMLASPAVNAAAKRSAGAKDSTVAVLPTVPASSASSPIVAARAGPGAGQPAPELAHEASVTVLAGDVPVPGHAAQPAAPGLVAAAAGPGDLQPAIPAAVSVAQAPVLQATAVPVVAPVPPDSMGVPNVSEPEQDRVVQLELLPDPPAAEPAPAAQTENSLRVVNR